MEIILTHKHFEQSHLEEVKNTMTTMGAPKIKAIWSEIYGAWLAVEGCHRIRAAKELNLIPEIIDISEDETVIMQIDGEDEEVNVSDLLEELTENAPKTDYISFEEE